MRRSELFGAPFFSVGPTPFGRAEAFTLSEYNFPILTLSVTISA